MNRIEIARSFCGILREWWMNSNLDAQKLEREYGKSFFRPDHFAIRTIDACGFGLREAADLLATLGYARGGRWPIPEKHIMAWHFEPPGPFLEKIFVSCIQLEKFPHAVQNCVKRNIVSIKEEAQNLAQALSVPDHVGENEIAALARFFLERKWVPGARDFQWLAKQKGTDELCHIFAWGLIPNHFTILLKAPDYRFGQYTSMPEFSRTLKKSLHISMKDKVEGNDEGVFCQTATKARQDVCEFSGASGNTVTCQWPRSYVEFAARGIDPKTNKRFEGFVPAQATEIFQMTKRRRT